MLVPAHASAGAEGFGDPRFGPQRAQGQHEGARCVNAAVWVGQRERLLFGHRVGVGRRVEFDVTACCLAAQPLGHVARVCVGSCRELLASRRFIRECLVESEPVPDDHASRSHGRAQVADESVDEIHELVLVDGHL